MLGVRAVTHMDCGKTECAKREGRLAVGAETIRRFQRRTHYKKEIISRLTYA